MPIKDKQKRAEAARRYLKNPSNHAKHLARVKSHNARFRAARRAFLHELKSVPCMDCGGRFDPVCMDFDHRPGEIKLMSIGDAASGYKSNTKLLAEIAKCDVVCANCHRLRTKSRGQWKANPT